MTIFSTASYPAWRREFAEKVYPLLARAHGELTTLAARLRDPTIDVWTELPTDRTLVTTGPGLPPQSLEGWRVMYRDVFQFLSGWNTDHGAQLAGYDSAANTALTGILASVPAIAAVFNGVVANYRDGGGDLVQTRVSQADRDTIAAAIEAELQQV